MTKTVAKKLQLGTQECLPTDNEACGSSPEAAMYISLKAKKDDLGISGRLIPYTHPFQSPQNKHKGTVPGTHAYIY